MIRRIFSSTLPRSSNPIIIRLQEDTPIRTKMARGMLTYPRRRLVFDVHGTVHSIFMQPLTQRFDISSIAWLPAAIYSVMFVMRFDIFDPINYVGLVAITAGSFVVQRSSLKSRKKRVYHMLVSKDFENIYLGMKSDDEGVEVFGSIDGLTYFRVPLDRILFFGYTVTYECVKKGMSLQDAHKFVTEKHLNNVESKINYLFKKLTKKDELPLTMIFYDSKQNEYVEATIDMNNNSLRMFNDYIECLRDKNKLKFFSS